MSAIRRFMVVLGFGAISALMVLGLLGCNGTMDTVFGSGSSSVRVTAPEDFLGYQAGADYKLTTYEKATEYLDLIASQTDRMVMQTMGETSMGKPHKLAIISSSANMKDLERYRQIAEKLSLARGLSREEAVELAREGKTIAWIDAGLHASECAPSEHLIQLAYDLVSDEDEFTRRIRHDVITLLAYANPDGTTMVAEWYMKNLGTEYENASMPWLYHLYTGHDNNRDGFNVTQKETQNMTRVQNHEWFPNVVYNHHQTAPFPARIWVPPYGEPTNPNKPPLVTRWENLIGSNMGKMFDESGRTGAISRISFDGWYPGYMSQACTMHNTPGILTETALYRRATPHFYEPNEIRGAFSDLTKGAFYPSPWSGGWWRIGDAVDYCLVASKAVLDTCSRYRQDMLFSKYTIATDIIEGYQSEKPYGWVIPSQQADPSTAVRLMEKFLLHGIEIYTADEPFTNNGQTCAAGSWVIPTSQPFGMFVKTMMEKQNYPDLRQYTHLWQGLPRRVNVDDKDPLRPYDVGGWTLPVQMGVEFAELENPINFKTSLLNSAPLAPGIVSGFGDGDFIFSASDTNSFTFVDEILKAGGTVKRAIEPFRTNVLQHPAGTFIAMNISAEEIKPLAAQAHINIYRDLTNAIEKNIAPLRLGHFKPWQGNMDEGWMRWVLEEYKIPCQSVTPQQLREPDLIDRFNVLSFASMNSNAIINGNREGANRPEYVGGIGKEGVENLRQFALQGGRLIFNEGSCAFAVEHFGLPIKNVMPDAQADGFYAAGSVVKMNYDNTHPIGFGMPEHGAAFIRSAQVFAINQGDIPQNENITGPIKVVGRFPDEPILISGYLEKDELMRNQPTVLEVPYGKGKIILFGFSFHNRAQTYADFKLFFNALYYPEM